MPRFTGICFDGETARLVVSCLAGTKLICSSGRSDFLQAIQLGMGAIRRAAGAAGCPRGGTLGVYFRRFLIGAQHP